MRDLKLISLEDAIRKMTSLPAQTFGFRDRGLLRPGFAADLVIFDENTINDRATFDKPHQYATGISYVLVNGEMVFADGAMTGARPGVALRGLAITVPTVASVSNLNSLLEGGDVSTPARLPRRGPRLSSLWSRGGRIAVNLTFNVGGLRQVAATKAPTGRRTLKRRS